jgi:hypothetical protein
VFSDSDVPGVLLVAVHVGPEELVCKDGTNTLKLPDESVYR